MEIIAWVLEIVEQFKKKIKIDGFDMHLNRNGLNLTNSRKLS